MSDLTFNKIAGAVLATGLALVGLRELSAGVFAPEEVTKPGYAVEVAEEGGSGAAGPDAGASATGRRSSYDGAVPARPLRAPGRRRLHGVSLGVDSQRAAASATPRRADAIAEDRSDEIER